MLDTTVVREDGMRGTVVVNEQEALTPQSDFVIPVVTEELHIETHQRVRGRVQLHKRVETREEVVDVPVASEQVVVERIAVNRLVDVAPEPRDVDGVLIIPVVEEVLVVEKRFLVREEVRVSRRRTTTSTPQKVVLRREVIDIDRQNSKEEQP